MEGDRGRRHEDVESRELRAPAEVEVLERMREAFVRWTDLRPRVLRDEHGAGGDETDLADPVVLALVDLPRLERGVGIAEAVGRHPDLPQDPPVDRIEDLRTRDAHPAHALGGV